jgi:hypothetical protein
MSKVKYRVKLHSHAAGENLSTYKLDILSNIGKIKPVKMFDGTQVYYSESFDSIEDANNAILDYKTYGLQDMEPAVEYNGNYYTIEEFEKLLKP